MKVTEDHDDEAAKAARDALTTDLIRLLGRAYAHRTVTTDNTSSVRVGGIREAVYGDVKVSCNGNDVVFTLTANPDAARRIAEFIGAAHAAE
jgi:hypothetical protein